ncbi:myb-like protein X [Senna tora]|uniref:Myb-like protein X n=1 Tax=Senna tora TaxID=362788 RepID=A0A834X221_9FABA|nr:myb-like protein X [Senna tora]
MEMNALTWCMVRSLVTGFCAMSRCFPFPPPGYEKKGRRDDVVDLLEKEKQREKKHKKEKRDKEKKESKEKREKEGKDGKHKEKKDKKEKHRDKRKDKDRDKDKEKDKNKNNTVDEKGFPGQTEGPNAGKLHQKEIKQKDKKDILFEEKLTKQFAGNNGEKARETNNHLAEENKDSKFLQELGRRIKDNDGGAGNQLAQKEFGRRIKEEGAGAGNQFVQKFGNADHKKDEEAVRLVAKGSGPWPDGKEKLKDKSVNDRKIDGQGILAEARPIGSAAVQNHAGNFHSRVDTVPRSFEKSFDKAVEPPMEARETSKEKKDDKRGEKRKDRDKEKKGHGKDKDRDKEKKKEKAKEQTEHKNTEQNKFKESNKGGPIGTNSLTQVPRNSLENAVSGENLKKRKDIESNGVLHANHNWPSKVPRPSSSSHPLTENGRTVKPCQSSIPLASNSPGAATNLKVDNKEHKKNGIIEVRPSAVSPIKTITSTVPADPVAKEASAKPPHPDLKYLSQVYSVPKMDEWSCFDDQEWLFSSSSSSLQEKKPAVESSVVGETPQVWAEALHIEPADVYALPYVIPY